MIRTYEKPHGVLVPEDYVRLHGLPVVPTEEEIQLRERWVFTPGMRVVHHSDAESSGIVVGVVEDVITVLWGRIPKYLSGFANIAFPVVKRVMPGTIAQDVFKVQPMTLPSGLLFYLDYKYGSGSKDDNTPE